MESRDEVWSALVCTGLALKLGNLWWLGEYYMTTAEMQRRASHQYRQHKAFFMTRMQRHGNINNSMQPKELLSTLQLNLSKENNLPSQMFVSI